VYLSACVGNIGSLRVLLREFGFTDEEKRGHIQNLLDNKQPYAHFCFNVDERTFTKVHYPLEPEEEETDSKGRKKKKMSVSARDTLALARATRYLSVLDNEREALCCFELLYAKLDRKSINPSTLEISLQTKGQRQPVQLSLISYIACLTGNKGTDPPSRDVLRLHKYCREIKGIRLPEVYVANKRFH
jgi:hypothetical protein